MQTLAIDIETYSSVSLAKAGVYPYAESDDFMILLFGYSIDGEAPEVIDLASGEELPDEILMALINPEVVKTAWNAQFERVCLSQYLGLALPAEGWEDTQMLAAAAGLPRSLELAGQALGLVKEAKDKRGKDLIRLFSIPNRKGERVEPESEPKSWIAYKEYNRQDVVAEQAIRKIVKRFHLPEFEQEFWEMDQKINDLGVRCDLELAENAVLLAEEIKNKGQEKAKFLTGIENPNSAKQVKEWIEKETGYLPESLNKKEIANVKKIANSSIVDELLDIRADVSKSSVSKYEAMLRTASGDGRIRGLSKFYGAARTGRWSGRLVQMQNLPRNSLSYPDLEIAKDIVKRKDLAALEILFGSPADCLSQLIRTAFIPEDGFEFIVSDFSAIEARVLAWLADETWRLKVFATHGRIYEASAEQMFKLEEGSVTKDSPLRRRGKIAELALGYGGAIGALKSMGALEMGLELKELGPLVTSWRQANKKICDLWSRVDSAVVETLETGKTTRLEKGLVFKKSGPVLRIKLPSGRCLSYVSPSTDLGQISYMQQAGAGGSWIRTETYGAKLVENIVQAIARDCLAFSMKRLWDLGIRIVFHVHDEVVLEVPKGHYQPEEIEKIMGEPLEWANGLLLKAAAFTTDFYRKD